MPKKILNSLEEGKAPNSMSRTKGVPLRLLLKSSTVIILCIVFSLFSWRLFKFGSLVGVINPSSYYYYYYYYYDSSNVESNGLDQWIKPPSNLMHKMSDQELFWRATFVPKIEKYPFDRKPKIAFMFLTKGSMPLAPLWERFFKGNEGRFSIYVHTLPGYSEDLPFSSVFYRRQIPSKLVEWGEMSMGDAERRLLANALLDISNEWFVLLSESCIPLYNFSVVHSYITESNYSFIGAIDEIGPDGRGRYNENLAPEVNLTQWRKGYQWFEVNRKLAISIVEDTTFYPKFKAFCKQPCYVDEHYFPTMLYILAADRLANRSITYVDWSRVGSAHPATFGKGDISEELFKKIAESKTCEYNGRNSSICYLFARKFAPSSLEPLLQLASSVLGY